MPIKAALHRAGSWCAAAGLGLAALGAQAQTLLTDHAPSWYVQAAVMEGDGHAASLGLTLPWKQWTYGLGSGQVTGHWDIFASRWSSRQNVGRLQTTVFGIVPSLRWRGDQGRSVWFAQVGTGLAIANKYYSTPYKAFSTRYNFATHLAVGMNFGARRQHEWMLRVEHVSNAGIKQPNPGENFFQLRYGHRF